MLRIFFKPSPQCGHGTAALTHGAFMSFLLFERARFNSSKCDWAVRNIEKMKILTLAVAVMASIGGASADPDREFTRKTLQLKFEKSADAQKWSLRNLNFKEWLQAVAIPEWMELYKSESDDFYFAVYRSGDFLIFCQNDRKDAYRSSSNSIRAMDDKIAYGVWQKPSMWTILKWNVEYPSGGYQGQTVFTTWKIIDGFAGEVVLNYCVGNDDMDKRQVLNQPITWNRLAK